MRRLHTQIEKPTPGVGTATIFTNLSNPTQLLSAAAATNKDPKSSATTNETKLEQKLSNVPPLINTFDADVFSLVIKFNRMQLEAAKVAKQDSNKKRAKSFPLFRIPKKNGNNLLHVAARGSLAELRKVIECLGTHTSKFAMEYNAAGQIPFAIAKECSGIEGNKKALTLLKISKVDGNNLLHLAAKRSLEDVLTTIDYLGSFANELATERNKDGKIPYEVALHQNHLPNKKEMASILLSLLNLTPKTETSTPSLSNLINIEEAAEEYKQELSADEKLASLFKLAVQACNEARTTFDRLRSEGSVRRGRQYGTYTVVLFHVYTDPKYHMMSTTELSEQVCHILREKNVSSELFSVGLRTFSLVHRQGYFYDFHNLKSWGENAIVIDSWAGKVYLAKDFDLKTQKLMEIDGKCFMSPYDKHLDGDPYMDQEFYPHCDLPPSDESPTGVSSLTMRKHNIK